MNQQNLKSKSCLELDFLAKFKFSVGLVWFGMVFWYISYVNSTFYIHKVWYWKGHFVGTLSLVWYGLVWCQLNITCRVLVCISACPKSKSNICIENLDFFWYQIWANLMTRIGQWLISCCSFASSSHWGKISIRKKNVWNFTPPKKCETYK